MAGSENLLIIDDDREWCEAYVRAASSQNFRAIKVANDFATAKSFIDDMQFAVAFVDVGLDARDEDNVDGLRVMDKIRRTGDQTSIVVVTGRTSTDVLPITRDAIMKYNAHEVIRKSDIEPRDIRRLLQTGLLDFQQRMSAAPLTAHDVLRGSLPRWSWDDTMLRVTGARGGVRGFYALIDDLVAGFLPVVARSPDEPISVVEAKGVAHGSYWSRSTGQAIAICYGGESAAEEISGANSSGTLLGRYNVAAMLKKSSAHGMDGAVFSLQDELRSAFGAS
jgi:ActR/RegA family two-component response regulator